MMYNEKENSDFLREKLNSEINLPESLSKENIVRLISAGKTGKPESRKGIIRRFVAVGVAACLMITGVSFLWSKGFFSSPEGISDDITHTEEIAQSTADSYDELLTFIKAYAKEYKENNRYYFYTTDYSGTVEGVVSQDDKAQNTGVAAPSAPAATPSYNTSVSETVTDASGSKHGEVNLREQGVREADIFITDGEYLYCIDNFGRRLRIIKAESDGTLKSVYKGKESLVDDRGNGEHVDFSGLYVYENYLVVGFSRYNFKEHRTKKGCSGVQIYDISDKSAPVLSKEIALDGNYVSSRIIDSSLVLVTRYSIIDQYETTEEADLIPAVYNGEIKYSVPCDCIVYSPDDSPETYVNIVKIELENLDKKPSVSAYLGNVSDTYCTKDTLYMTGTEFKYGEGVVSGTRPIGGVMLSADNICTTVTKADISGDTIDIKCRTEIQGNILNSYSIDEYNGFLRVAVTAPENNNCIYVFDENLGKVGEITGLATGEQIKSARFMGNTAYVVTFVQTDPLFVIDLTDPEKPVVKGEVKLPGFSSYLHPAGDGLLVGIGLGGTETGTDGSSKISLFDVSDPTKPREIDFLKFPTSHIGTDSKAFCSVTENSFLVTYSNWTVEDYEEIVDSYKFYTGALAVSVKDKKLNLDNAYILKGGDSATRATFIDNNVYVFGEGDTGVASFNKATGELIDTVTGDDERFSFEASERPVNEILY